MEEINLIKREGGEAKMREQGKHIPCEEGEARNGAMEQQTENVND